MEIWILLALALALCGVVGWVSQKRGRSFALGFWLSFFLTPLFGLLVLMALPAESAGVPGESSGLRKPGLGSVDSDLVRGEWAKTCDSLDVRDYDDFVTAFPGTKSALLALKQKRLLQDWLAIDRADGAAIERLLDAPVFPALSKEIRRFLEQEAIPSDSVAILRDRLRTEEKDEIDKLERDRIAEQERLAEARAQQERKAQAQAQKIDGAIKQFGRWTLIIFLIVAIGAAGFFFYSKMTAAPRIAKAISMVEKNMIEIPVGAYTMGSSAEEVGRHEGEGPQRVVTIDYRFEVGMHEVTWAEYSACVMDFGCAAPLDDGFGKGSRPVTNVSWDDANAYTSWLSRKTGKSFRLLTEAEWEYAARAGSQSRWSFGDDEEPLDSHGWYWSNSNMRSQPVAKKAPNAFGLYDMHGNVWEWVEDCHLSGYKVQPSDGSAYVSELSCDHRVIRGGSWDNIPESMRSARRHRSHPQVKSNNVGFRVARTL